MAKLKAWYFAAEDRKLRYEDGRKVRKGVTHKVTEDAQSLGLCRWGLHASAKPLDALEYGAGPVACYVELSGKIVEGDDKACATERTYLAVGDARDALLEFTCWCALRAIKHAKLKGPVYEAAADATRGWGMGTTTRQQLHAVWAAAKDAACAAAGAARDAARATWAAARAAWAAAWAAGAAAWDAARVAAGAAGAAAGAAGAAARDAGDAAWAACAAAGAAGAAAWAAEGRAQNRKLSTLLKKAVGLAE